MVETREQPKLKTIQKQRTVECLDCHCIDELRTSGDKVFLKPFEVLSTRSIETRKAHLKRPIFLQKSRSEKMETSGTVKNPQNFFRVHFS